MPQLLINRVLGKLALTIALLRFACCVDSSAAAEARPLMREFVGINGHTVQFKPALYQPVCTLVRDYHPVEWDLGRTTAELPEFPLAKNQVDWSNVYGAWREKGWLIDVCLMFESIKRTNWNNIETDTKAYARAFAREFGPSGNRKLVNSIEIGNEPGKWSDEDYTAVFRSMAEGIRQGDPKLKIVTCNVTTGKSGDYEKSVNCVERTVDLFDVLNVHSYAQLTGWPTWRRSFPEDPKLKRYLPDIKALCAWRDQHAPTKAIWITEFGYDSSTKKPQGNGDTAKWIGVTDEQQAQWLVRSLLVFSSMPVERAYIYFFNDQDKPSLHASAGITRNFQPKPSFHALAHLQRLLGNSRFDTIVTNAPGRIRVQQYREDANKIIWVVWSPTGEGKNFTAVLPNSPGKLVDSQRMPLTAAARDPDAKPVARQKSDGTIEVAVEESPIYLVLEKP